LQTVKGKECSERRWKGKHPWPRYTSPSTPTTSDPSVTSAKVLSTYWSRSFPSPKSGCRMKSIRIRRRRAYF